MATVTVNPLTIWQLLKEQEDAKECQAKYYHADSKKLQAVSHTNRPAHVYNGSDKIKKVGKEASEKELTVQNHLMKQNMQVRPSCLHYCAINS